MEVGLGIHGEPGREKKKINKTTKIVEEAIQCILSKEANYFTVEPHEKVVIFVNNLGATTNLEMAIIVQKTFQYCQNGVHLDIERLISGTFKTSLDMHGISITLMKVDEKTLSLIDYATDAPGWPKYTKRKPQSSYFYKLEDSIEAATSTYSMQGEKIPPSMQDLIRNAINLACHRLISNQNELDVLDKVIGDGDCGSTMKKGAEGILRDMDTYDFNLPHAISNGIGKSVMMHMGGTSGAIYNIFFTAASSSLTSFEMGKYAEYLVGAFSAGIAF